MTHDNHRGEQAAPFLRDSGSAEDPSPYAPFSPAGKFGLATGCIHPTAEAPADGIGLRVKEQSPGGGVGDVVDHVLADLVLSGNLLRPEFAAIREINDVGRTAVLGAHRPDECAYQINLPKILDEMAEPGDLSRHLLQTLSGQTTGFNVQTEFGEISHAAARYRDHLAAHDQPDVVPLLHSAYKAPNITRHLPVMRAEVYVVSHDNGTGFNRPDFPDAVVYFDGLTAGLRRLPRFIQDPERLAARQAARIWRTAATAAVLAGSKPDGLQMIQVAPGDQGIVAVSNEVLRS